MPELHQLIDQFVPTDEERLMRDISDAIRPHIAAGVHPAIVVKILNTAINALKTGDF